MEVDSQLAKEYQGLGGWLILVATGLILTPVFVILSFWSNILPFFQEGLWEKFTDPTSPLYQRAFAPMLIGEMVCCFVTFLFSLYLIYLFFKKSRKFPKLYIMWLTVTLIVLTYDTYAVVYALDALLSEADKHSLTSEGMVGMVRHMVQMMIWIPYMLKSIRVRATFIE